MYERISTPLMFRRGMNSILNLQTELANLQNKISTGNAFNSFIELRKENQIESVFSFNSKLRKLDDFMRNNKLIENRLNAMESAVGQILEVASDMRSNLTLRRSPVGLSMKLAQIAKAALAAVSDQLNLEFESRYLFSGSRTSAVPVGDIVNNSNTYDDLVTANYYKGDNNKMMAHVSDSLTLDYGVRANEEGFQELIASLHYMIKGDITNDDTKLNKAFELLDGGIDKIVQIKSNIGNNLKAIGMINDQYDADKLYLEQIRGEIVSTDIAKTTTLLYANQANLQASYSTFSRLTQLSLNQYL
jgi:flagellar hook-associated protein 3 FlgL